MLLNAENFRPKKLSSIIYYLSSIIYFLFTFQKLPRIDRLFFEKHQKFKQVVGFIAADNITCLYFITFFYAGIGYTCVPEIISPVGKNNIILFSFCFCRNYYYCIVNSLNQSICSAGNYCPVFRCFFIILVTGSYYP